MRWLLTVSLTMIFICNLFGQDTKLIVRKSSDIKETRSKKDDPKDLLIEPHKNFVEEYYVLISDENIQHGSYVKYCNTIFGVQILESGNYRNGRRNGHWDYFYNTPVKHTRNTIREKGAYVDGRKNGVWISYYPDTIPETIHTKSFGSKRKTDSLSISIDQQSAKIKMVGMYLNDKRVGEWISFSYSGDIFQKYNFSKKELIQDLSIKDSTEYNTNRNPLFIGGLPCLMTFLSFEFNWHKVFPTIKDDSTSVIVSFTIDKEGNALEPRVDRSTGNKSFASEALRVASFKDNKWIPALSESVAIESIYRIHFYIIQNKVSSTSRNFILGYEPILDD